MSTLRNNYLDFAKKAGEKPDLDLLGPIESALTDLWRRHGWVD